MTPWGNGKATDRLQFGANLSWVLVGLPGPVLLTLSLLQTDTYTLAVSYRLFGHLPPGVRDLAGVSVGQRSAFDAAGCLVLGTGSLISLELDK